MELRSGYLVVQPVMPRTGFSLAKPVGQKLFELTQSAVAWKRNTLPNKGSTAVRAFWIRCWGVEEFQKGQAGVVMLGMCATGLAGKGKHRRGVDS